MSKNSENSGNEKVSSDTYISFDGTVRKKPKAYQGWLFIGVLVAIGVIIAGFKISNYSTDTYIASNCTVTAKYKVNGSSRGTTSTRMFIDSSCGTFGFDNNKFVNDDEARKMWNGIEEKSTYEFKIIGNNVPLMGWYPLVTEVK